MEMMNHSIYYFKKMFQDDLIERADLDAVAVLFLFLFLLAGLQMKSSV